ncbi:MAG TPA: sialidase family protein [Solirubrobacteraceae bacterium]|nr:sialidase family protein [Solirubrobacteraceae bacterium]
MTREFVFADAPASARCHAATIAALPSRDVLAAWFEGTGEGAPDTAIWLARRTTAGWGERTKVADLGPVAHWNPVLFLAPDGTLHLFFKVGDRISAWQTWTTTSGDGGMTWSPARELVPGDRGGRGPVKNKPIVAGDGAWLAPASIEGERWDCFVDASRDGGRTWQASALVPVDHDAVAGAGLIQPALWESPGGSVHMLTRSTAGCVYRSDSGDGGRSWSAAYPTALPNNNSGLDLARLAGGTLVLAHNPVGASRGARTPLVLSISRDDGASWEASVVLEDEGVPRDFSGVTPADTGIAIDSRAEFSYPAVVPYGSGVAVAYTWKRTRIAFVRLGEDELGG